MKYQQGGGKKVENISISFQITNRRDLLMLLVSGLFIRLISVCTC